MEQQLDLILYAGRVLRAEARRHEAQTDPALTDLSYGLGRQEDAIGRLLHRKTVADQAWAQLQQARGRG